MLRHVAQPRHAGGLEANIWVGAAGDGVMNDGLLLLVEELYKLLLGRDVPSDQPVCVIEKTDDSSLFRKGRERQLHTSYELPISTRHFGTEGRSINGVDDGLRPQKVLQVGCAHIGMMWAQNKKLPDANTWTRGKSYFCQVWTQFAKQDVAGTETLNLTVESYIGTRVANSSCPAFDVLERDVDFSRLAPVYLVDYICNMRFEPLYMPMLRHFTQPRHAGGFHRGIGL